MMLLSCQGLRLKLKEKKEKNVADLIILKAKSLDNAANYSVCV